MLCEQLETFTRLQAPNNFSISLKIFY